MFIGHPHWSVERWKHAVGRVSLSNALPLQCCFVKNVQFDGGGMMIWDIFFFFTV